MKIIKLLFILFIFQAQASVWPSKILTPESMLIHFLRPLETHMEQVLNNNIMVDHYELMEFRRFFKDETRYVLKFNTLPIDDGLSGFLETQKAEHGDRFIINIRKQVLPSFLELRSDLLSFKWHRYFLTGEAAFSWNVKKLLIKKTNRGTKNHFLIRIADLILTISEAITAGSRIQVIDFYCKECETPHSTISVELNQKINLAPEYYVEFNNSPSAGEKRQLSPYEFFSIYQGIISIIQNSFMLWKEQIARAAAWPK